MTGIYYIGGEKVDVVGPVNPVLSRRIDAAATKYGDIIVTAGGADKICSLGGADNISSGDSSDAVDAGAGNDEVDAGEGNDIVYAGAGDDDVQGGSGDDLLLGEDGNDVLEGEDGADQVDGGNGSYIVYGGLGRDLLLGYALGASGIVVGGFADHAIEHLGVRIGRLEALGEPDSHVVPGRRFARNDDANRAGGGHL